MPRICQSCCRRTKDDETILWTDHGPGEEGVLPEQIISFLNYSWSGLRVYSGRPKNFDASGSLPYSEGPARSEN